MAANHLFAIALALALVAAPAALAAATSNSTIAAGGTTAEGAASSSGSKPPAPLPAHSSSSSSSSSAPAHNKHSPSSSSSSKHSTSPAKKAHTKTKSKTECPPKSCGLATTAAVEADMSEVQASLAALMAYYEYRQFSAVVRYDGSSCEVQYASADPKLISCVDNVDDRIPTLAAYSTCADNFGDAAQSACEAYVVSADGGRVTYLPIASDGQFGRSASCAADISSFWPLPEGASIVLSVGYSCTHNSDALPPAPALKAAAQALAAQREARQEAEAAARKAAVSKMLPADQKAVLRALNQRAGG